jgi:hypothetical protein
VSRITTFAIGFALGAICGAALMLSAAPGEAKSPKPVAEAPAPRLLLSDPRGCDATLLTTLAGRVLSLAVGSAHASDIVPTRDDSKFLLEIRFLPRDKVIDQCRAHGVWARMPGPRDMVGCALFYQDREPKQCVVIVPEPKYVDDQNTLALGHEILHCARGRYH